MVRLYTIELKAADFEDNIGDWERLCNGLSREYGLTDLTIDIFALRTLPGTLRAGKWTVTVSIWNDKEVIRIQPGRKKTCLWHGH